MNRELKFRAWDGERMLYNEYGEFYLVYNSVQVPSSTGHEFYTKYYPVMQFTGLLDKNGTEIYEGDILRATWNNWSDDSMYADTYTVVFGDGMFYGHTDAKRTNGVGKNDLPTHFLSLTEVIGNIHESKAK